MQLKTHTYQTRECLFDLLFLGILFIIFYTFWLGSYPFFTPDEGRYSEVAREMVASSDFITPRVNGVAFLDKPVLYYWLQAISILLFGVKEWALRLFPALFGVMGCLATYLCGRQLYNRRTGLISAIILATTPLYFVGGHYANLDLEVAVLISCSLFSLIAAFQSSPKPERQYLLAAYIFAALGFLTKGLIAIAFPCLIGGIWILLMGRWDLLKKMYLLTGLCIFLLIALPWYFLVQKANPEFFQYFFITQQVTRFLSTAEFNNPTPFWFYLPIVLVGFFSWSAFIPQALCKNARDVLRNRSDHATELFLLLWIFIIFIFFSIPRSKMITYILPLFPPFALLIGNFIANAWEKTREEKIYLSILTLVGLNTIVALIFLSPAARAWMNFPESFNISFKFLATILLLNAGVSLFLIKKRHLFTIFMLITFTNAIFLLTFVKHASSLNQTSSKPLITELKNIIKPEDEVVHYYKFYQDVPLYLGQKVTLVADWTNPNIVNKDNWVRELWYGMPFQETSQWLINEATFWQRFESEKRVFVFLNNNYFEQFKSRAKHYFLLGQYNDIILLSNQPTNIL